MAFLLNMKKKAKKIAKRTSRPAKPAVKKTEGPVRPLGDRVLVKHLPQEAQEERTASGIIIPVTVTDKESGERPEHGVVVAVGAGKRTKDGLIAPEVKVGNKVMFNASYSAKKIKIGGVEHYFVSEEDIIAVLDK